MALCGDELRSRFEYEVATARDGAVRITATGSSSISSSRTVSLPAWPDVAAEAPPKEVPPVRDGVACSKERTLVAIG